MTCKNITLKQPLQKLEPSRGGYYYLTLPAETVKQFPNGPKTRLLCILNKTVTLHCGLNHTGTGDFFIIIATRYVKAHHLKLGEVISFTVEEDALPLGVELPLVLSALLEQEETLKQTFDGMTDGKKRSLIFLLQSVKDIDKQVQKAIRFLEEVKAGRSPLKRRDKENGRL